VDRLACHGCGDGCAGPPEFAIVSRRRYLGRLRRRRVGWSEGLWEERATRGASYWQWAWSPLGSLLSFSCSGGAADADEGRGAASIDFAVAVWSIGGRTGQASGAVAPLWSRPHRCAARSAHGRRSATRDPGQAAEIIVYTPNQIEAIGGPALPAQVDRGSSTGRRSGRSSGADAWVRRLPTAQPRRRMRDRGVPGGRRMCGAPARSGRSSGGFRMASARWRA
jgi:hypothetical protein